MRLNGPRVLDTVAAADRLAEVTGFVRASSFGAPQSDPSKLELIVEELFLNIAMHACPGEPVRVVCSLAGPSLVALEFSYGGPPFDPTLDAPTPDLDASLADRPIGGLGLFLVHQMAASFAYHRVGGTNRLTVEVALDA